MTVTLTPESENFVRSKVASGEYQSADLLINEGLRVLAAREKWRGEVATKVDVGWEQAKTGEVLSPEEVKAAMAEHKAKFRANRPA